MKLHQSIISPALLLLLTTGTFAQTTTYYQGSFTADSRSITFQGNWKIVQEGEAYFVELADNFKAKKAPDLKLFFSTINAQDISSNNAADTDKSVLIAPLTSYQGTARYPIPPGINPAEYKTLLVHCQKYTKLWGGSPLQ